MRHDKGMDNQIEFSIVYKNHCNNINNNNNSNRLSTIYKSYVSPIFNPTFSRENVKITTTNNFKPNSKLFNNNNNNSNSNSNNNNNNQNNYKSKSKSYIAISGVGVVSICIGGLFIFNFGSDAQLLNVVHCQDATTTGTVAESTAIQLDEEASTISIDTDSIVAELEQQLTNNQIFWKLIRPDIWVLSLGIAQQANAQTTAMAQEALGNIRTVVAFASQDTESSRFAQRSQESLDLATDAGVQIGIFQGVTSLALNAVSLLVYWYGGTLVSAGTITSGQLTSFILHTMSMQNSFSQLSILFTQLSNASGGMSRVTELLNRSTLIPRRPGLRLSHIKGRIEFVNVGFRYPSREHVQVLNKFNLTVKPGQVVALAGQSGGGKSTVAALLERFYEANEGEILVDGVPITQLSADWLRNHIGIVNQEPALFATSILDNLRYGKPDATVEEIEEACRQANAHHFISSFPNGYSTMVGEKGVQLSGGQKQRIAIARAILKNPRILILDEATSALDSESEGLVQDALTRLMAGRTTLVIAHRLSTVQNADAIAVIANGKVAEFGTHTQLMSKNGQYYNLVQRQLQQHQ
ncbi:ABC transporter B family protein [Heterostelium album PN500]|uniref:ABC transporter B family protein n=1 Tax=Heterostelium pallidum (strain ATCC 26659 / Pp 5 / PN500) TaxID=670386 RepID=D3BL30_HETP5|nr:ABC transporter B family protein [Heterostelium album PN500]EFA77764.1 ABC transporter B family protein [Heterostelium album PN500]|eukprot:XP_020429892.1 ABC transporter B family protein [Heterostelium album PN500]